MTNTIPINSIILIRGKLFVYKYHKLILTSLAAIIGENISNYVKSKSNIEKYTCIYIYI